MPATNTGNGGSQPRSAASIAQLVTDVACPAARGAKECIRGLSALLICYAVTGPAWAQNAVEDVQTAPPGNEAPQGFFDIIFAGGWIGFSIVTLLFALSMTATYLVFEHLMTIRKRELMPEGLADQLRTSLAAGRVDEVDQLCRSRPCLLSFVVVSGVAEIEGGWSAVEKATEDALAEQSARLFRKIEYLSVIGNIAPMIGLLGTVTGMIFAFQQVASTQGAAGAGQLAEGIYQALVTTVGGLIVAIPALAAFAIFRNRIDQMVAEAAYMIQHTLAPLKRRQGPVPPPVE